MDNYRKMDMNSLSKEEKVVLLLRKCGHFLHHSGVQIVASDFLKNLSESEIDSLFTLLEKIVKEKNL